MNFISKFINNVVMPAKAGIQSLHFLLKTKFTTWIPAFAGMTAVSVLLVVPSCKVEPPKPPLVQTLAVLPFDNESNDLNAADILQRLTYRALKISAYQPMNLDEVNGKLDAIGIKEGGQLPAIDPVKLGKDFGVQALLYGYITNFDYVNLGFYTHKKVTVDLKLVDVGTGQTIWENSGTGYTPTIAKKDEAAANFAKGLADQAVDKIFKSPLQHEAEVAVVSALKKLPGFVFSGFGAEEASTDKKVGITKKILNGGFRRR